jgi:predicted lipoprotein with Yx(FWY)xxD motif
MMLHSKRTILAIAILPVLAVGLAACGGSSNSSDPTTAAATGGAGGTVTTKAISGTGTVLVDSNGAALYTNDMDRGQKIACTGSCLTEWVPLAAPSAGGPGSADSNIQSMLGTVKRPDGSTQVTFGGKPLYSFVEDQAGQVTGNGFSDQFDGTSFVWTVATSGGSSAGSSPPATTTQQSSGGGYGGGMGY